MGLAALTRKKLDRPSRRVNGKNHQQCLSSKALQEELGQAAESQARQAHDLLGFGAVVTNLHFSIAIVLDDGVLSPPAHEAIF